MLVNLKELKNYRYSTENFKVIFFGKFFPVCIFSLILHGIDRIG